MRNRRIFLALMGLLILGVSSLIVTYVLIRHSLSLLQAPCVALALTSAEI